MTVQQILFLLGVAALVAGVGDEIARQTSRRTGFLAAGPFLLIAAAPLIPNRSVILGFSLDDALPLLGLALMIPLVPWDRLRAFHWNLAPGPTIAFLGIATMIAAGILSAIVVAGTPGDAVRLAVRGSGRLGFLLAVVVCVAVIGSTKRSRLFSARVIAAVGTVEASFGLIAYFIGLPGGAGLEMPRGSVLIGEVPGRVSGTIGLSPNFTAAILMMSVLVTAGLALRADDRRERIACWLLGIVQFTALTLTYTRVSLGLTIVGLVVLVLLRSRPLLLAPIVLVLVPVATLTPMLERIVSDVPDRLALWSSAFLLMIDHPVGGIGAGQMLDAVAADPERYRATIFGEAWSTAHNTVLMAGAETGVLGAIGAIILNLGLLVVAARAFVSAPPGRAGNLQVAASLALVAFLVQGMVNNLFTVGVTGVCAAFLLGSQILEARLGSAEEPSRSADEPAVQRGWTELLRSWRRQPPQQAGVGIHERPGGV